MGESPKLLPIAISEVHAGDADVVRELMRDVIRAGVTSDPHLIDETVANVNGNLQIWLNEPHRCVHLKAEAGGRIVGVVLVKDFWNLCSLFVASDMQGRGVGRGLVEAAIDACTGRSPKQAIWLNAAGNAVGFYRRLGFTDRESARQLPPGFRAMQRSLGRPDSAHIAKVAR